MVDVESDDDDEPPVVGAAVEGLPEADAEMSDGAAPAVEVKNDQQMPGPVAPPVLDAREQELEELKRKYDALLQSMQQLQLQKLGPNSPEHVKSFSPATQHTTPGGSSSAGDTPAGSISSTDAPPPTDTRT